MARGYGLFGLMAVLVAILLIAPFIKRFSKIEGYVSYSPDVIAYAKKNVSYMYNTLVNTSDLSILDMANDSTANEDKKGFYRLLYNAINKDTESTDIINNILINNKYEKWSVSYPELSQKDIDDVIYKDIDKTKNSVRAMSLSTFKGVLKDPTYGPYNYRRIIQRLGIEHPSGPAYYLLYAAKTGNQKAIEIVNELISPDKWSPFPLQPSFVLPPPPPLEFEGFSPELIGYFKGKASDLRELFLYNDSDAYVIKMMNGSTDKNEKAYYQTIYNAMLGDKKSIDFVRRIVTDYYPSDAWKGPSPTPSDKDIDTARRNIVSIIGNPNYFYLPSVKTELGDDNVSLYNLKSKIANAITPSGSAYYTIMYSAKSGNKGSIDIFNDAFRYARIPEWNPKPLPPPPPAPPLTYKMPPPLPVPAPAPQPDPSLSLDLSKPTSKIDYLGQACRTLLADKAF